MAARDALLEKLGQELVAPLNAAIDMLAQAQQKHLQGLAGKVLDAVGDRFTADADGKLSLDMDALSPEQVAALQASAQSFYWDSQVGAGDLLDLARDSVGLNEDGTRVAGRILVEQDASGLLARRAGDWRKERDKGEPLTKKQLLDVLQRATAAAGTAPVGKPPEARVAKAAQRLAEREMRAKGSYAIKRPWATPVSPARAAWQAAPKAMAP